MTTKAYGKEQNLTLCLNHCHQNLHRWLRWGYLPSCKILSRSDNGFHFGSCATLRTKLFTRLLFGRLFVKRFTLCYRSVVCPVLSVTLVYCGQKVGRIKMKLGMQLGPGPGHIVLDGDPALPSPKKGAEPPSPDFRPISIVAKRVHASRCHLVCR